MPDETPLTPDTLTALEGFAGAHPRRACAACGQLLVVGTPIVTTLGDMEVQAIGVTVHAACAQRIGRSGLLALMTAAYRAHVAP